MGPVRRRLTLAAAVLPTPALAEVCDKVRPRWVPGTQATAWTEAVYLFSTIPSIILLALTVLCLLYRSLWGSMIIIIFWSGLATIIRTDGPTDPTGIHALALKEGCIASPALFIAAVAAICMAMIVNLLPRRQRPS